MNQVLYVNSKNEIIVNDTDALILVKGKNCKKLNDYFDAVYKKLNFPKYNQYSFDAYIDWMTDITFFKSSSTIFVIDNFDKFLSEDEQSKKEIVNIFKEDILPFWENGAESICVGGKKRSFNVYLLNGGY